MSTINPSLQIGGVNGWKGKEGAVLGWQQTSGGLFKPVPITLSRDSEAYVEKNGVLTRVNPDVPRIDSDGALLVEPQRTNLILRSEEFDSAAWNKTNATISADAIAAPDGATTADKLVEDNTSNGHFVSQNLTLSSGTTYSISVFAKADERSVLQISPSIVYLTTSGYANFDLTNGVVSASGGGVTGVIESYSNGWYKCTVIFTANASGIGATAFFTQNSPTALRSAAYLGDGSSGIYIWGGQVEAGSYPTSYIKTEGATATRSADVVSQTGLANLLGDAEGSLYIEASWFDVNTVATISLSDGTINNRVQIDPLSGTWRYVVSSGGVLQFNNSSGTAVSNTFYKVALRYAVNDFRVYVDGSLENSVSSGSTFSDGTLTALYLNLGSGTTQPFYGRIKALAVYDTALDNSELANITTNGI